MNQTNSIRHLLAARKSLEKAHPVDVDLVINVDFAFLQSKILITGAFAHGVLRFDDVVDHVARLSGYAIAERWDLIPKGPLTIQEDKEYGELRTRMYDIGQAFTWGLPRAIVNPHVNPYIGNVSVMQEIHNGIYNPKALTKCEMILKKNGHLNPKGSDEAKRLGYINLVIKG
jgi:hypothetical protein